MRIWDQVPPANLCRQHLLAQWREGLGLWNILTQGKRGYANHPETLRWVGREANLYAVLGLTRAEMLERGWSPKPLPGADLVTVIHGNNVAYALHFWRAGEVALGCHGDAGQLLPAPWDDQLAALAAKGCDCIIPEVPA